jgi:glucosyl-3-phosphoglycerate synthase
MWSDRPGAAVRTFDAHTTSPDSVLAAKGSTTVSVCLPARDEAATVGAIVAALRDELVDRVPLVDEIVVLDDRSTDATAEIAAAEGATVVAVDDVHPEHGHGHGKGNVLWSSVAVSKGDVVVWLDADLTSFDPAWVAHLVAPLFADPSVMLVKGFYERPIGSDGQGGGRTTELVARPLLSLLYPELSGLDQPLGGEMAGRRTALEQVPFVQGWGVEVGLLTDVLGRYGATAIAQVDLGVRRHRHRPLTDLSVQAAEIIVTLLTRSPDAHLAPTVEHLLRRPDGTRIELNVAERPPLTTLDRGRC